MNRKIPFYLICLLFLNCKTNQTINGKREGGWITQFALDSINNKGIYKTKEYYRRGVPIRTWKVYLDGKLTKKEKYRNDSTSIVTEYYPNGKIMKSGGAKIQYSKKEIHWFYSGPWKYFDEKGKLFCIKHYENGLESKIDSIR
ncbi:hypothetical protein [Flavobacterium sp.]|uniref:hypothetical protein n=1 Tax=Flavobacterium sp. TaxID=239 RepID=UPI003D0E6DBC